MTSDNPSSMGDRDHGLRLNPEFSFANFVVGPKNRLAYAAAQAVAAQPGRSYNPLFIHGDVGLGKTHLLQAICLAVRERDPSVTLCYFSCEGFITQFIEAVRSGQMSDFRHRFSEVDILVIDDIQTLGAKDRTQEEFFHTFNSLYQAQKQIVLSSDAPPDLIPDLQKRLVSRFKWGLVTQIDPPCFETRTAILQSKARLRGIDLPADVASFVAQAIDTNIRELEGAIGTLQITASVEGVEIDLDLAKRVIGGQPTAEHGRHATIQTIVDAVTDFYGVRLSDLQSKRRARSVTIPRQVCMFLARRCTRHSLEEIGGYFGGRDHTTVMHAVRMTEERREQDPEFKADLDALEQRFLREGTEPLKVLEERRGQDPEFKTDLDAFEQRSLRGMTEPLKVLIDPTYYSPAEAAEFLSILSDLYELDTGDRLVIDSAGCAEFRAPRVPVLPGGGP